VYQAVEDGVSDRGGAKHPVIRLKSMG
jgi:hypothetical protein